jgi:hypothetical protein
MEGQKTGRESEYSERVAALLDQSFRYDAQAREDLDEREAVLVALVGNAVKKACDKYAGAGGRGHAGVACLYTVACLIKDPGCVACVRRIGECVAREMGGRLAAGEGYAPDDKRLIKRGVDIGE